MFSILFLVGIAIAGCALHLAGDALVRKLEGEKSLLAEWREGK